MSKEQLAALLPLLIISAVQQSSSILFNFINFIFFKINLHYYNFFFFFSPEFIILSVHISKQYKN